MNFKLMLIILAGLFAGMLGATQIYAQPLRKHKNEARNCILIQEPGKWDFGVRCQDYDLPIENVLVLTRFSPEYIHHAWWHQVAKCTAPFNGDMRSVSYRDLSFYAVHPAPGLRKFFCWGRNNDYCSGAFDVGERALVLSSFYAEDEWTVKHEYVHARGFSNDMHNSIAFSLCADEQQLLDPLPL